MPLARLSPVTSPHTQGMTSPSRSSLIMRAPDTTPEAPELVPPPEPSVGFERLRVATASRATLLRLAHQRLELDLRDLRDKAAKG